MSIQKYHPTKYFLLNSWLTIHLIGMKWNRECWDLPPPFPLDPLFCPLLIFLMVLASKVPDNSRALQSINNKEKIINICENVNGDFFLLHEVWLCNTSFRCICDFILSHLLTYILSRKRPNQFLYGFLYLLTKR